MSDIIFKVSHSPAHNVVVVTAQNAPVVIYADQPVTWSIKETSPTVPSAPPAFSSDATSATLGLATYSKIGVGDATLTAVAADGTSRSIRVLYD
jgi:hypothetical protein